ncbi:MAG: hypothetical protein QGG83_06430, partial [Candidatus Woesearchaeota archaeon]|nr:hypothetical protein [Candidatus Woesearchaeota archaeon]
MRTKLLSLLMVGMLLVAAAPVVEAGLFADFLALFTPRAPTPTDTTPSEPTGAQGQVGSPGDTGPTGQTGPSAIVITPNDEAQVRRAGLSPANQDLLVAAVTKRNLARAAQERTPRSTHRQTALRESEAELKQATIDTGFQPLAFGGGIETSILETGGA